MAFLIDRKGRSRKQTKLMPNLRFLSLFLFSVLLMLGCFDPPQKLVFLNSPEEPIPTLVEKVRVILNDTGRFEVEIKVGDGSRENIQALKSGEADFAVVENNALYDGEIKTVLPLYASILHIFYRGTEQPSSFLDLVRGKNIYFGAKGGLSESLFRILAENQGLDSKEYSVVDNPWDVNLDVYFVFGGLMSRAQFSRLEDFNLFSFDDVDEMGAGTFVEGVSLRHPQLRPFIIPRLVYGERLTPEPVVTLSVETILIARKDVETEAVFEVTSELLKERQDLSSVSPLLYTSLKEPFSSAGLSFPFHDGTLKFIERNTPRFLERYAEIMAFVLTGLVALSSAVIFLLRWAKQRRKDRIDGYYKKVISIRDGISQFSHSEELEQAAKATLDLQSEAFALLVEERLEANESFSIYITLCNDTLSEIKSYQASLENQSGA